MKKKKIHSKVMKSFSNSIGAKEWDRELWVAQVIRLAMFKYNLDESDIKKYIKGKRK